VISNKIINGEVDKIRDDIWLVKVKNKKYDGNLLGILILKSAQWIWQNPFPDSIWVERGRDANSISIAYRSDSTVYFKEDGSVIISGKSLSSKTLLYGENNDVRFMTLIKAKGEKIAYTKNAVFKYDLQDVAEEQRCIILGKYFNFKNNNKWGVYDENFHEIIPPIYNSPFRLVNKDDEGNEWYEGNLNNDPIYLKGASLEKYSEKDFLIKNYGTEKKYFLRFKKLNDYLINTSIKLFDSTQNLLFADTIKRLYPQSQNGVGLIPNGNIFIYPADYHDGSAYTIDILSKKMIEFPHPFYGLHFYSSNSAILGTSSLMFVLCKSNDEKSFYELYSLITGELIASSLGMWDIQIKKMKIIDSVGVATNFYLIFKKKDGELIPQGFYSEKGIRYWE
jgi:hypothetical protein